MSQRTPVTPSLSSRQTRTPANASRVWVLGLIIGVAAGAAALGFRKFVETALAWHYDLGADGIRAAVAALPWWWVMILPALGGLAVGLILRATTSDGRVHSVAETIEAAALNEGRVALRPGLGSAAASVITLSTGGSTGQEGPVVHLGATLAGRITAWANLPGPAARDVLGCAVAAAVSASFNAPIAGMIFALEVVLRHYALHAVAPIALAAVSGTVINRLAYGQLPEYTLPDLHLGFYVELPAFLLLGLLCGVLAAVFMRALMAANSLGDRAQAALRLPGWLRPALTGLLLGLMALWVPEIIGVGYETTSNALSGNIALHAALGLAVAKAVAVALTMSGRMGGGVFSPALMLGALTGLGFGIVATALLPSVSGEETVYALAGMGAFAGAVLGAPISTALIVFELTGDWQTGIAVLVAVAPASAVSAWLIGRSFFHLQLDARGVALTDGPQRWVLERVHARDLMQPIGASDADRLAAIERIPANANLHELLLRFEASGAAFLIVADTDNSALGLVHHQRVLEEYASRLARLSAEHYG